MWNRENRKCRRFCRWYVREKKVSRQHLGVVTVIFIDSGNILDVAGLSKSWKGCTITKKLSLLVQLVLRHGSYLIIVILIVLAFRLEWKQRELLRSSSSKEKHGLYYTSSYGDSDSKAYSTVKDIYGPTKRIKKFECVGHYQKSVASRFRNLKKKRKKKHKRTGSNNRTTR